MSYYTAMLIYTSWKKYSGYIPVNSIISKYYTIIPAGKRQAILRSIMSVAL